jgi:hypothetical protein
MSGQEMVLWIKEYSAQLCSTNLSGQHQLHRLARDCFMAQPKIFEAVHRYRYPSEAFKNSEAMLDFCRILEEHRSITRDAFRKFDSTAKSKKNTKYLQKFSQSVEAIASALAGLSDVHIPP